MMQQKVMLKLRILVYYYSLRFNRFQEDHADVHEIHTPKSTQQRATVVIKSYIPFQEERGGEMFRKFSIKLKHLRLTSVVSRFI